MAGGGGGGGFGMAHLHQAASWFTCEQPHYLPRMPRGSTILIDSPAQKTSSRAVTVKPAQKGGFDSETTPRECRGEVDVEEVGCECCCCGFWGRDFVIFSEMLAGRTLNTNWSCRVNSICM